MKHGNLSILPLSAAFTLSMLLMGACAKPAVVPDSVTFPASSYTLIVGDETLGSLKLAPAALLQGSPLSDASFTYETADPAVASVSEDGTVTALAAGRTTVSATFVSGVKEKVSARCELRVYGKATAEEINSFDEKCVNLYGRMELENGLLHVENVGAGIEIAFRGSYLKGDVRITGTPYAHINIDGVEGTHTAISANEAFVFAENLGDGIHTVHISKSSEAFNSRITFAGFEAEEFLAIPERSGPKMEFLGDSITAGFATLAKPDEGWSAANSDGCLSYAYLTAKALDARYSILARSGIATIDNGFSGVIGMNELVDYISIATTKPYNHDRDMDVVVLALGTNDASYILEKKPSYKKDFPIDYAALLTHLRELYPKAHIVCIYGMMGTNNDVRRGIEQAIADVDDAKISYKNFPANTTTLGHPSAAAHTAFAKTLTEYIQSLLQSPQGGASV